MLSPGQCALYIASADPSFFGGESWWYNLCIFLLAVVGLPAALCALWVAIVQILKTRKAAEAAREAAVATTDEISKLKAVLDVSHLCQLSAEVIHLLRERNLRGAAIRALDLRAGIAQVRFSPRGRKLLSGSKWQHMITDVSTVHELLEEEGHGPHEDGFPLQKCLATISRIYVRLNALAGTAVAATGEH